MSFLARSESIHVVGDQEEGGIAFAGVQSGFPSPERLIRAFSISRSNEEQLVSFAELA